MCHELERLTALTRWLAAATAHSRRRRRDGAPREAREIARHVRQTEERRLLGNSQ
jgi:hypothetical protein